jgi:hypothetical protein
MVLIASKSAVHEIEARLGFLIATVSIGCAEIIEALSLPRRGNSISIKRAGGRC